MEARTSCGKVEDHPAALVGYAAIMVKLTARSLFGNFRIEAGYPMSNDAANVEQALNHIIETLALIFPNRLLTMGTDRIN